MTRSAGGPRLILICGMSGAGKTTLAKSLEAKHRAIRLSADDWMQALSIDLYDHRMRGKIEQLQCKWAGNFLQQVLPSSSNGALGRDPNATRCDLVPVP
jgi:predicted kinase